MANGIAAHINQWRLLPCALPFDASSKLDSD
jgi:hypothetical protein